MDERFLLVRRVVVSLGVSLKELLTYMHSIPGALEFVQLANKSENICRAEMSQMGNRNSWRRASCCASSTFPTLECVDAWRYTPPASHPHSIKLISFTNKRLCFAIT